MSKRSYDEAFEMGNPLDLLGNATFKMMALPDPAGKSATSCRQEYLNAKIYSQMDPSQYYDFNLDQLASLTDIEILDAAKIINSQQIKQSMRQSLTADPIELRKRDIRKIVMRKGNALAKQNLERIVLADQAKKDCVIENEFGSSIKESSCASHVSSGNSTPNLRTIPQEDIKIDYLEQMTKNCRLQVSQAQASKMTELTDRLTKFLQEREQGRTAKMRAESELLKKAYKIQAQMLENQSSKRGQLEAQIASTERDLEKMREEIAQMEEYLRVEGDAIN